jgi:Lon protease-like protein
VNEIPDAWPPPPPSTEPRALPVFALPEVWLFPSLLLPLHVFEPRYRQMVEDGLDGPGRFVLATLQPGYEGQELGSPPIHAIAGLATITHHERLEDGRYNLMVRGLARVEIEEVPSDRPYRKALARIRPEIVVPPEHEKVLHDELLGALTARRGGKQDIPPLLAPAQLTDLLVLHMPLPHAIKQELFSELDVERRARRALEEHRVRR